MAGIYIHIPFCKQSCYYCDFHFSTSLRRKSQMLNAIATEIRLRQNELKDEVIETIYFGGGTPSLLSTDEINDLLNLITKYFKLAPKLEITLEANPDDLHTEKIKELSESPINRLSIGIQSFHEKDLKMMNRAHTAIESKKCLTLATKYFENSTVDLIYGIPNMTVNDWVENLQTVFDFGIPHISSYALTVEPKTVLQTYIKRGKYPAIKDDLTRKHFEILIEETQKNGFIQYETSNFGKKGYFSKHNMAYWLGKKYLGIGPSAHSFNETHRSWNISNNAKYVKALEKEILPSESEALSVQNQYNEYIMTGLRTIWGVSTTDVRKKFGINYLNHLIKTADKFIKQDLLELQNQYVKVTPKGAFLVDGISAELFMI